MNTEHCYFICLTSGRQGLSFRGNWKRDEGVEINSNFYQLLNRIEVGDPCITKWINKNQLKDTINPLQLFIFTNVIRCSRLQL